MGAYPPLQMYYVIIVDNFQNNLTSKHILSLLYIKFSSPPQVCLLCKALKPSVVTSLEGKFPSFIWSVSGPLQAHSYSPWGASFDIEEKFFSNESQVSLVYATKKFKLQWNLTVL